jgi:hypothetical protein
VLVIIGVRSMHISAAAMLLHISAAGCNTYIYIYVVHMLYMYSMWLCPAPLTSAHDLQRRSVPTLLSWGSRKRSSWGSGRSACDRCVLPAGNLLCQGCAPTLAALMHEYGLVNLDTLHSLTAAVPRHDWWCCCLCCASSAEGSRPRL